MAAWANLDLASMPVATDHGKGNLESISHT